MMTSNKLVSALICCSAVLSILVSANGEVNVLKTKQEGGEQFLSMIGGAHLQYHPTFSDDVQSIIEARTKMQEKKTSSGHTSRTLGKKSSKSKKKGSKKSKKKGPKSKKKGSTKSKKETATPTTSPVSCDPADVELLDYPQWEAEKGYWIGEYTFLQGDGNPNVSSSWNYPYDHYKGFITGEVSGNSYRQRNVFLYPPQVASLCDGENPVVGDGVCGTNGNTKVFMADQTATTCSLNEELGGDIQGPYFQGGFELPTTTELVGKDNALLYQVFVPGAMLGKDEDILLQSQLTTITESPSGQMYRTRTAQSFDAFVNVGESTNASFYRERKVTETEFYESIQSAITDYNIRSEDLCVWDSSNNVIPDVTGSFEACKSHLEESFALGNESNKNNVFFN